MLRRPWLGRNQWAGEHDVGFRDSNTITASNEYTCRKAKRLYHVSPDEGDGEVLCR
jgi:hypothetical protein